MSLTIDVYEVLRRQIIRAERAPGTLLYEVELASEFQVSKTPIREALRLLAQSGWVVILPRRGYLVRPIELSDVRDIFAVRGLLEPPLASQACAIASRTKSHIVHLEDLLSHQSAAGEDLTTALDAARQFHLGLAQVAGSPRVVAILGDLVDEVRRLHFLLPNIEYHITSAEEIEAHTSLIEALRDNDGDAARQIMDDHLTEVARTLVRGFSGL